jgi:hypothetical protein
MLGVLYACLGLIFLPLFALFSLVGAFAQQTQQAQNVSGPSAALLSAMMFGFGILMPIIYGVQHRKLRGFHGLIDNFEAHLAGGAGDNAKGGFVIARVEVFALGVHDVHDLFTRHFADLRFVGFFRTGSDIGRFF